MSLETRSNSAVYKRSEQLRRWEESETNHESAFPKNNIRKIKFSAGCIFLAACAAGEKEEVQRLIEKGADINTTDEDEMTALHQACIDNNLEMVEFLVEHGADINKGDNDGWTPLHATSNCGFVSIARYLLENGANVAAVNSDAELPIDVAMSDDMEDLLQEYINAQGIDCDEARSGEENIMLEDAKRWLNSGVLEDYPHPKTGATALHVSAAKGYIKVMSVLIQAGADINAQDNDGWTPLHAAAHWGQKEACEILVENFCDMEKKNFLEQTPFDVADSDMLRTLEELKKKQATLQKDHGDNENIIERKGNTPISKQRSSLTRLSVDKTNLVNKEITSELGEEENLKVKKVEVKNQYDMENSKVINNEVEKKNRVNKEQPPRISSPDSNKTVPKPPTATPKIQTENDETWKRPGSFRSRISSNRDELPNRTLSLRITETPSQKPTPVTSNHNSDVSEVVLRRTQSFEADEKFRRRYLELQARIKAGSCPSLHPCPASVLPTRSSSFRERHLLRHIRDDTRNDTSKTLSTIPSTTTTAVTSTSTAVTTTPPPTKTLPVSPATSPLPTSQIRRSFVPPVRDEESETQRKAHAKRVRETRRSTQGVTLEEIKTAEQLVKKKNQQLTQSPPPPPTSDQPSSTNNTPSITATITTAAPTIPSSNFGSKDETNNAAQERRPSWRLRVDNVDRSKFLLEDVRNKSNVNESLNEKQGTSMPLKPTSVVPGDVSADTTVRIALRRLEKPPDDDKEQDKENEVNNQATQGVIQRRRRPKRRSTGVVHVDMEGTDTDQLESPVDTDSKLTESGNEHLEHSSSHHPSSRSGSISNLSTAKDKNENNELDYKKLYEEAIAENERLRVKLRETEDSLRDAKLKIEGQLNTTSRSSLTELEKRERRALERKLSEMEEELRQLQKLKAENERLKAENRALTRVVSKLTTSANATK